MSLSLVVRVEKVVQLRSVHYTLSLRKLSCSHLTAISCGRKYFIIFEFKSKSMILGPLFVAMRLKIAHQQNSIFWWSIQTRSKVAAQCNHLRFAYNSGEKHDTYFYTVTSTSTKHLRRLLDWIICCQLRWIFRNAYNITKLLALAFCVFRNVGVNVLETRLSYFYPNNFQSSNFCFWLQKRLYYLQEKKTYISFLFPALSAMSLKTFCENSFLS